MGGECGAYGGEKRSVQVYVQITEKKTTRETQAQMGKNMKLYLQEVG